MEEMYKSGDIVKGVVTGIQPYGAFINISETISGLVHISEISSDYVRNIEDYLTVGQEYDFYIIEFDKEHSHAKLSLKRIVDSKVKRKIPLYKSKKKLDVKTKKYFEDTIDVVHAAEDSLEGFFVGFCGIEKSEERVSEKSLNKPWVQYCYSILEKDNLKNVLIQDSYKDNDYFVIIANSINRKLIQGMDDLFNGPTSKAIYMDENTSSTYINQTMKFLADKRFGIIIIDQFAENVRLMAILRIMKDVLIKQYGNEEAKTHILVITDEEQGSLRSYVRKENVESINYMPNVDDKHIVLSNHILGVLSLLNINTYDVIQGYRKAALDVKDDPCIVEFAKVLKKNKIVCSNEFEKLNDYVDSIRTKAVKTSDLALLVNEEAEIKIVTCKDHLKDVKQLEGKDIDICKINNSPYKFYISKINEYNIGYLLFYLSFALDL